MTQENELWLRLIFAMIGLSLVVMAIVYCVALWIETRSAITGLGVLTLLALVPLSVLRILTIPERQLLPAAFVETASLFVNAAWPLFGLAWLAALLRERYRLSKIERKYLKDKMGDE